MGFSHPRKGTKKKANLYSFYRLYKLTSPIMLSLHVQRTGLGSQGARSKFPNPNNDLEGSSFHCLCLGLAVLRWSKPTPVWDQTVLDRESRRISRRPSPLGRKRRFGEPFVLFAGLVPE